MANHPPPFTLYAYNTTGDRTIANEVALIAQETVAFNGKLSNFGVY